MTDFYSDMRDVATELLTTFAQGSISYVRLTAVAGASPDAPEPSTETLVNINAVVRGVQFRYVQRGLAVASDLQVTFSGDAVAFGPSLGDFIEIDGVRYKCVQIVAKPAAGTPVVWTIIVRK